MMLGAHLAARFRPSDIRRRSVRHRRSRTSYSSGGGGGGGGGGGLSLSLSARCSVVVGIFGLSSSAMLTASYHYVQLVRASYTRAARDNSGRFAHSPRHRS